MNIINKINRNLFLLKCLFILERLESKMTFSIGYFGKHCIILPIFGSLIVYLLFFS